MRGKPNEMSVTFNRDRNIPAYAGKTYNSSARQLIY